MNKQDLINQIAESTEYTKVAVADIIDAFTKSIVDEVAGGGTVALVGFGSFKAVQKAERQGRNPKTGETITIAASNAVKFSAGQAFKDAANPKRKK